VLKLPHDLSQYLHDTYSGSSSHDSPGYSKLHQAFDLVCYRRKNRYAIDPSNLSNSDHVGSKIHGPGRLRLSHGWHGQTQFSSYST